LNRGDLDLGGYDRMPRQKAGHVNGESRDFKDHRGIFTEEQVRKETERCLGCGATVVDTALCVGCGVCTTKCKFDAVSLSRVYDGQGAALTDMKPIVIRQMIKRKLRIAKKKMMRSVKAILGK